MTDFDPIDVEYFFRRLFGQSAHHMVGPLQNRTVWTRYLRRGLRHLRKYVEANVPFTDSVQRERASSLLDDAEGATSVREQGQREQALAISLVDLCLLLLGGSPHHWDRRRVSHPNHFLLTEHRTLHYSQSVEQRARMIFDRGTQSLPSNEARAARERYWRTIHPRPRHAEFVEWFRDSYPEAYIGLFA